MPLKFQALHLLQSTMCICLKNAARLAGNEFSHKALNIFQIFSTAGTQPILSQEDSFFSPCVSLYILCFLSSTQKLQAHLLFCSLINSLTHAFLSFHFGCCLTDSPDSKAKALPLVCSKLGACVTTHQGKSARGSCFALNTTSLFSISNKGQK